MSSALTTRVESCRESMDQPTILRLNASTAAERIQDRRAVDPPSLFPPWPRVYAFFSRWRDTGLVAELHDRLRGAVRDAEGREEEASAAVMDSRSVKADATAPSLHGDTTPEALQVAHPVAPMAQPGRCRGEVRPPAPRLSACRPGTTGQTAARGVGADCGIALADRVRESVVAGRSSWRTASSHSGSRWPCRSVRI
jgi:hypothetical protein